MIFGNKETFAIECEIGPKVEGSTLIFGNFLLWAGGTPIGNFDEGEVLTIPAQALYNSCAIEGQFVDASLSDLSEESLLDYLQNVLYGMQGSGLYAIPTWIKQKLDTQDRSPPRNSRQTHENGTEKVESRRTDEVKNAWNKYSKFHITYGAGELFDDWFVIRLDEPNRERLIWRKMKDGGDAAVYQVELQPNEFSNVVRTFLEWFRSQTGWEAKPRAKG